MAIITPKIYTYFDLKWEKHEKTLPEDLENKATQALKNYTTSRKYFFQYYYYIICQALKSYHLSTYDRKIFINNIEKSNIAVGLIRSFVDIFVSVVQERPLTFLWTPINKKGQENKSNILKSLAYVSDASWFHKTIKTCLKNFLINGRFCMRVNYMKTNKKMEVMSIINGENTKEIITTDDSEIKDFPTATEISVFNVFPDSYNGKMRYITERWVVSHFEFKKLFSNIINRKDNKSTFKDPKFIDLLPIKKNQNDAKFYDYGSVVNSVHKEVNKECKENNAFSYQNWDNAYDNIAINTQESPELDADVTDGLIEYLITTDDAGIVLHANNYPVAIVPNFYWFINYIYVWDGEWIPYLLLWIEKTLVSYVNNFVDGVKAIMNPTFIAIKNLLINENQLESWVSWGIVYADATQGADTSKIISRIEKGWVTDFWIYDRFVELARQLVGISEYNSWISAGERTATGALAVTQSSLKRISPYMATFVDALSQIAIMWLSLMKKNWTEKQWIYILDDAGNQIFEEVQNSDLTWGINLSLKAEWMFGSINELELQNLSTAYQALAKSPNVNAAEFETEIIKKLWFDASRFLIKPEEQPSAEDMSPEQRTLSSQKGIPTIDTSGNAQPTQEQAPDIPPSLSEILTSAVSPQPNFWNKGKWQ